MITLPTAFLLLIIELAHNAKGKGNWFSFVLGAMFGVVTVAVLGPIVQSIINLFVAAGSSFSFS